MRFYIGVTRNGLESRLEKHNDNGYGEKHYTSKSNDWELYIWIPVEKFDHSVRLERKIKSMKSSKYIENLKNYPELIEKICQETFDK